VRGGDVVESVRAVVRDPVVIIWLSLLVIDFVWLAMTCLALRDEVVRRR